MQARIAYSCVILKRLLIMYIQKKLVPRIIARKSKKTVVVSVAYYAEVHNASRKTAVS